MCGHRPVSFFFFYFNPTCSYFGPGPPDIPTSPVASSNLLVGWYTRVVHPLRGPHGNWASNAGPAKICEGQSGTPCICAFLPVCKGHFTGGTPAIYVIRCITCYSRGLRMTLHMHGSMVFAVLGALLRSANIQVRSPKTSSASVLTPPHDSCRCKRGPRAAFDILQAVSRGQPALSSRGCRGPRRSSRLGAP
jgi:hypothetical protein